jgi:hypothetical protein
MKKVLLIILVFQCSISYSQEFSMTDQGNKWGYRSYDEFCDPEYDDCYYTVLHASRVNGETTINGTTYAILQTASSINPTWYTSSTIREEEGVVYRYSESNGESILYDFTLEVGDAIEIENEGDCSMDDNENGFADVIDVSTQFIAGENRKVITFDVINGSSFSNYVQWIEGIGSTNNFSSSFAAYCHFFISLECFNNGDEIFTFSGSDADCDSLLSLPETSEITTSLAPNPITEQATLTISTFQPNTILTFYNILGQHITQKELTSSTTVINRSDFPSSGIYFYQIQNEGTILNTQKFIVK